jgi:cephalosporin hydroxylase
MNNKVEQEIIDNFHKLYYHKGTTWQNTIWMGIKIQKCPLDLFIYQELLYEIRPDLIIETGTLNGGSAYYMAHICDILGNGKIITVDITSNSNRPFHQRVEYILGSSIDHNIINYIGSKIDKEMKVLVILDSDHSRNHVRQELELYNKFVTKDSYLIVEDGNINNHPVYPSFGPGPMEAIEDFLINNNNFIIDKSREKFMLTFNPNGYLKRV